MLKKEIIKEERKILSPWVTLLERTVKKGNENTTYHSFEQDDYVSIIAINENKEILLVKQYRPAVDKITIELPGGLLELGETPESCARKELIEETGYEAVGQLHSLGNYCPDTGRLANRFYGFYCSTLKKLHEWSPENGDDPFFLSIKELPDHLNDST